MTNLVDLRRLLEFDKITERIKEMALSPMAREKLESLDLLTDRTRVLTSLKQVSELRAILEHDSAFPLNAVHDIRNEFKIAAVPGNFLKPEGLIHIAENLSTSRKIHGFLKDREETHPEIWKRAEKIQNFQTIEREILRKIDSQTGEIKDDASAKLNSIRRNIRKAEQNVRKAVDTLFKRYSGKGYLQENLVTLREGQLVLPVKLEHKGRVKGVVHEQSASGATLFIEPYEALELNNEIKALKVQENQEIERILKQITDVIRAELNGIHQNFEILAEFDLIHAKARFAREFDCHAPDINEGGMLDLRNAKHPLLLIHKKSRDQVVPLNLQMGDAFNTLVITGPNAGGKTVALKTVGLSSLMVQTGLPIPAEPDSSVPVFTSIYADIGDFQSIENDLSTFSSHINKIGTILDRADDRSLVLIDEIGVGTDPDEGAALAVAILEELTRRQCLTIVTTHHGALKSFAYETDGVENGSMEFDSETLEPVYRFRAAVPGSSYALEISRRLGISEDILRRSKELVGAEKGKMERLILELERKVQESEKTAARLEIEKSRLEGLSNLYKERYESIKDQESKLKQKALAEARETLKNSNALIERAIKEIRESQADAEVVERVRQEVAEQRQKVERSFQQQPVAPQSEEKDLRPATIAVGEEVFWQKQNKPGQIVAIQEGSDKVLLQVENMKFWVSADELSKPKETTAGKEKSGSVKIQMSPKSEVLPEIDLRGHTLDEAIAKVDKFLDDALLAGWGQVRIIHGKGTGALRKGIAQFLETHTRVKSKKMGAWNEGDMGVTVVDLN